MRAWASLSVFLLVLRLAADPARADECPSLRLDGPGGSMENVPVRDQGDERICYAMTAAEMADAYRFSHKPPKGDTHFDHQTSGFQVAALGTAERESTRAKIAAVYAEALKAKKTLLGQGLGGGLSADAAFAPAAGFGGITSTPLTITPELESLVKKLGGASGDFDTGGNVCPAFGEIKRYGSYRMLPSEATGLYGFTSPIYQAWLRTHVTHGTTTLPSMAPTAFGGGYAGAANGLGDAMLPGYTPEEWNATVVECLYRSQGLDVSRVAIEKALGEMSRLSVFTLGLAQEKDKIPVDPKVSCVDRLNINSDSQLIPQDFSSEITKHFRGKEPIQPLGLSICSRFLAGGETFADVAAARGADGKLNPIPDSKCQAHALLAIGMRKNPHNGRCDVLLRNSWGTSEFGYSKNWEPEHGNVWVDLDTLSKNSMGAHSLE
jgi:hypothetical protein